MLRAMVMLLAAGPALAQDGRVNIPGEGRGTLTIYSQPSYRGNAMTFRQSERDLGRGYDIGSIRAEGRWQVCERPGHAGRCAIIDRAYPTRPAANIGFTIRSVRAERDWAGGGNWGGGPVGPPGGPSLRGMAAQFWSRPQYGNSRVEACPYGSATASCAQEQAAAFCRTAGYAYARNVAMETENRRVYLADVLCSRR